MQDMEVGYKPTLLFKPVGVGMIELKNRIVMPPMATDYATSEGHVTQRVIDYYTERSSGGVGLVIVEAAAVSPQARNLSRELCIDDERCVEGLTSLAQAIHGGGAKAFIQLMHAGGYIPGKVDIEPVAPSPVQLGPGGPIPKELNVDEINQVIQSFISAAHRAKRAAYDGVELHSAHGYLIGQFFSPFSNRRTDSYGGTVEGRTRFAQEIIQGIKEKTGKDFVVGCRISGDEFVEGGVTLDKATEIARLLQKAGADYLSVSAGSWWTKLPYPMPPMTFPRGFMVYLADAVKRAVSIPVVTAGRINDPLLAETILREGRADLIAMGRALIADPELPRKAAEGKVSEIRPCIACNVGCIDRVVFNDQDMKCAVNPTLGKIGLGKLERTKATKKVLVIGGGPGGMTAATIAALRGHAVTLWEQSEILGGQMLMACLPPGKEEIHYLIEYMWREAERASVEIELGRTATLASIKEVKAGAIVLATGSEPICPPVSGIDGENVLTAREVLTKRMVGVGARVVVIGGGQVGCETADYLAWAGKKVTVLELLPRIASDMGPPARAMLLRSLRNQGVEMLTNIDVKHISKTIVDFTLNEEERAVDCDTVVIACGSQPNDEMADALAGMTDKVYKVGDAAHAGKILEAVESGWATACEL